MVFWAKYDQLRYALDVFLPGIKLNYRAELGIDNPGLDFLRFGRGISQVTVLDVVTIEQFLEKRIELSTWQKAFARANVDQFDTLDVDFLTPAEYVDRRIVDSLSLVALSTAMRSPNREDFTFEIQSFLISWMDQWSEVPDPEIYVRTDPWYKKKYLDEVRQLIADRREVAASVAQSQGN